MQRIGPRKPRYQEMPHLPPLKHAVKRPAIDMQHNESAKHEEEVHHQIGLLEEHRRPGGNEPADSHFEMKNGYQDRRQTP